MRMLRNHFSGIRFYVNICLLIVSYIFVSGAHCMSQETITNPEQQIIARDLPDGQFLYVLPYPALPGDVRNVDYKSLTVNGEAIKPVHFMDAGYVHFAFDGSPAKITITAYEPIKNFTLSPHSYNIEARASGHQLTFSLLEPRKLIVQINNLSPLFIFAEQLNRNWPEVHKDDVLNILDFDVDPTGKTVNTVQIQHAIQTTADLNGGRGGTLVFPPGRYLTGSLKMQSNVTLYLHGGALVQGTNNRDDYPDHTGVAEHLLLFHNVSNASIRGKGVFDAAGTELRTLSGLRHRVLLILDSENILIEDVTLRDSGAWNTHIISSNDVTLRNVKILCDVNLGNTDGIDPDSGSRITIENSFVYSGDDPIVLKQTGRGGEPQNVENITVRGNILWTRKSALKIGTETRGELFRNIIFEDNDIVHADRGIVMYLYDGAVLENIRFINNRFEKIGGDRNQKLFHIEIRDRHGAGHIRDVLIKDVYAEDFSPNDSVIKGLNENHRISGLVFENIVIGGRRRKNASEARIVLNEYVDYIFVDGDNK
jgi:hypothetical protein